MMTGKAKVPSSDLNNTFTMMQRKSTRKGSLHHKTIDHNQTTQSSFAQNASFNNEMNAGLTRAPGRFSGRNSLLAGKQSPIIMSKVFSPKVRSIGVAKHGPASQSEDTLPCDQNQTTNTFVKTTEDLNIASGDMIDGVDDYTMRATDELVNMINKNQRIGIPKTGKNRLQSFTIGSQSDVSTTVMAPSQAATRRHLKNPSSSAAHNFAELGAGLVNDTPRSKMSMNYTRIKSGNQR